MSEPKSRAIDSPRPTVLRKHGGQKAARLGGDGYRHSKQGMDQIAEAALSNAGDEIFNQSIKDAGIYDEIWQAFALSLPVKITSVQGDQRTYCNAFALGAVTSRDGTTAYWIKLDFDGKLSGYTCEVPTS
ncbi:hypothetical protein L2E82_36155 [Cichorium intybus]|uniref:Uncharacterized protein n=1 Tax=Cichorium intybus TaxID=13427 RepID=A0ACB9BQQ9_CICIN|nr:hypothetical protein L2E82_36155 [Cichorium intybus]